MRNNCPGPTKAVNNHVGKSSSGATGADVFALVGDAPADVFAVEKLEVGKVGLELGDLLGDTVLFPVLDTATNTIGRRFTRIPETLAGNRLDPAQMVLPFLPELGAVGQHHGFRPRQLGGRGDGLSQAGGWAGREVETRVLHDGGPIEHHQLSALPFIVRFGLPSGQPGIHLGRPHAGRPSFHQVG